MAVVIVVDNVIAVIEDVMAAISLSAIIDNACDVVSVRFTKTKVWSMTNLSNMGFPGRCILSPSLTVFGDGTILEDR